MFVYMDSKMSVVCIPEHVWIDFQRCSEVSQEYISEIAEILARIVA
jgi:hypothetical protein